MQTGTIHPQSSSGDELSVDGQVEDLRQIYLEHSRGRKKIDLVSFRKLMCYFGVTSKEVTDRVFEIKDLARGSSMTIAS